jgi:hypothetical protein
VLWLFCLCVSSVKKTNLQQQMKRPVVSTSNQTTTTTTPYRCRPVVDASTRQCLVAGAYILAWSLCFVWIFVVWGLVKKSEPGPGNTISDCTLVENPRIVFTASGELVDEKLLSKVEPMMATNSLFALYQCKDRQYHSFHNVIFTYDTTFTTEHNRKVKTFHISDEPFANTVYFMAKEKARSEIISMSLGQPPEPAVFLSVLFVAGLFIISAACFVCFVDNNMEVEYMKRNDKERDNFGILILYGPMLWWVLLFIVVTCIVFAILVKPINPIIPVHNCVSLASQVCDASTQSKFGCSVSQVCETPILSKIGCSTVAQNMTDVMYLSMSGLPLLSSSSQTEDTDRILPNEYFVLHMCLDDSFGKHQVVIKQQKHDEKNENNSSDDDDDKDMNKKTTTTKVFYISKRTNDMSRNIPENRHVFLGDTIYRIAREDKHAFDHLVKRSKIVHDRTLSQSEKQKLGSYGVDILLTSLIIAWCVCVYFWKKWTGMTLYQIFYDYFFLYTISVGDLVVLVAFVLFCF